MDNWNSVNRVSSFRVIKAQQPKQVGSYQTAGTPGTLMVFAVYGVSIDHNYIEHCFIDSELRATHGHVG